MNAFIKPKPGLKAYTCPNCGVLSRQYFFSNSPNLGNDNTYSIHDPIRTSICENCDQFCIWHYDTMVFPNRGFAPLANPDMPIEVKSAFEEAASISEKSPRGSAALLRLAIQKLCVNLGGKGENLNSDIALLVKSGLPVRIQRSLDIARVIGNNAVHPGQIDFDDATVVNNLFDLINLIADYMITMPNKIENLYNGLPEGAIKAIESRDNNSSTEK